MKNGLLKIAVLTALVVPVAALPVAANAALQYTPPQAMVLTCNGTAPNVLGKTSALATFACANGQAPQAVGITSGMGGLLGLASGAAALVASEAVPHLALPAMGGGSGAGSNGSGSGNGAGSNAGSNGSGSASNGSGSGAQSHGNGSSAGKGNGSNGNGSGAQSHGNGSGAGSNGSDSGANGSGSGANGSGSGASGSGNGNGSNGSGSGANAGSNGSGANGNGSGGWLGNVLHSVGQAVRQVGGQISQQFVGTIAPGPVLTGAGTVSPPQVPIPANAPPRNVAQAAGFPSVDAWLLQQMRANKAAWATSNGMIHIVVTPLSTAPFYSYRGDAGNPHHIYWGTFSAMVYYKGAPIITTGPQPGWVSAPQAVTYSVVPVPTPAGIGSIAEEYPYEGNSSLGTSGGWGPLINLYGASPLNYEPAGPLCREGPRLPCNHQMLPSSVQGSITNQVLFASAALDEVAAALGLQNYNPEIDWEN